MLSLNATVTSPFSVSVAWYWTLNLNILVVASCLCVVTSSYDLNTFQSGAWRLLSHLSWFLSSSCPFFVQTALDTLIPLLELPLDCLPLQQNNQNNNSNNNRESYNSNFETSPCYCFYFFFLYFMTHICAFLLWLIFSTQTILSITSVFIFAVFHIT